MAMAFAKKANVSILLLS